MTEPTSPSSPLVVVVGSVNRDIVTELDHLPRAGETVIARAVRRNLGGKGANQAVAAAIGCDSAAFIARVGDDAEGRLLVAEIGGHGVVVDDVVAVPGEPSGAAYIAVADGQNTIVVASGANTAWDGLGDGERAHVAAARVVVCQMEIDDTVIADAASATTGRFILNAAPVRPIANDVLAECDPIVVNEHELADLTSKQIDGPAAAIDAARDLRRRGARSVVATLGAAGAIWLDSDGHGQQPTPEADVVDSTGAGDLFVGTLAARLALGDDMEVAVRWATVAASISVGSPGTVGSYPDRETVAEAVTTPR